MATGLRTEEARLPPNAGWQPRGYRQAQQEGTLSILTDLRSNQELMTPQFYDPRVWVREGEKTLSERVKVACADLGNQSTS